MDTLYRYVIPRILEALQVSPIVFLNGARQSGKSTLAQTILDKIGRDNYPAEYITFDRPTQMAAAAAAPETFLTAHKNGLVIDEVQLVPEVFRALKVVIDELRLTQKTNVNGRYLLTGSANVLALPRLADPLVGRMTVITLYPFSAAEATGGKGDGLERILKLDFAGINDRGVSLIQAIERGTFPEIAFKKSRERTIWFDGYLSTILQRDVKMLADLEKIAALPGLLRLLAARAGNLVNDSEVARELGLNPVTSKFYRNILKMMFLNFDVPPWYRNIGKRLVKSPKGFLIDSALLCYLLGLEITEIQGGKPELFGHVLENFVATELTKLMSFGHPELKLYHFRTNDGKEVDFVIERPDGSLFGIEIKKSESVRVDDFRGLHVLADLAKKDFTGGVVLYGGKEAVPFGENLWAVPLHILWQ